MDTVLFLGDTVLSYIVGAALALTFEFGYDLPFNSIWLVGVFSFLAFAWMQYTRILHARRITTPLLTGLEEIRDDLRKLQDKTS